MSIEELAILLELSPGFIGLIERGQRGTTLYTIVKLSDIFGIPIDNFFLHTSREPATESQNLHKKIESLTTDFTEAGLCYVIEMIKGLRNTNAFCYTKKENKAQ